MLVAGRLKGAGAGKQAAAGKEAAAGEGEVEELEGWRMKGSGIWVFENWRVSPRKKLRGTAIL
jgi:hypothetical protein